MVIVVYSNSALTTNLFLVCVLRTIVVMTGAMLFHCKA